MSTIHLGTIAHTKADPFQSSEALEMIPNGAMVLDDTGIIQEIGGATQITSKYPEATLCDHGSAWIIPGLIDGHIHFPQFYATASYGEQLLDWLNGSIFPLEMKFQDVHYARETAKAFVNHLLAHGTTTALAFGSQYVPAMKELFQAARNSGLRLISGLTLMDRDAPKALLTTARKAYDESVELIQFIESDPLLHYAITPRFAISCSRPLLDACGQLKKDYPRSFIQTHINESYGEIETTSTLHPNSDHYLHIYDRSGLLHPHAVLAHSIHSTDEELAIMKERGATACHCPCSNLYLGSGLFPLKRHLQAGINVMVGTDIGGGGNFSMIRELADVYKVQQLNRLTLNAARLLYLGTLGGAKGLGLDAETGNFEKGKSADFIVLGTEQDPYLNQRLKHCNNLEHQLFVLLNQTDRHHVLETYVAGIKRHVSSANAVSH